MKSSRSICVLLGLVILSLSVGTAAIAPARESSGTAANERNREVGTPVELVQDGGFEAGTPSPFWTEASTNFGTPLCDLTICSDGGGTGPFAGSWWAFFGGIEGFLEQGSVSQTIQGGSGDLCTLSFWLEIPATSGNGTDFLEARIGGTAVWVVLESAGPFVGYTQITQDVSAWIDGTPQTLEFFGETSGEPGLSNFFVDEISLTCEAPIFVDGFESGDLSAWSDAVP